MAENKSFSISRKGYTCSEVDEYISFSQQADTLLRESYASIQEKYDGLYAENAKLRKDCTALALALQKLREEALATPAAQEGNDALLEEIAALKAENEALKAELDKAKSEDKGNENSAGNYSDAASKMISEVAQVVQRLEQDAQRKADAITAAAMLEQEKARLVKDQVDHEVRSLMSMLESFIGNTAVETPVVEAEEGKETVEETAAEVVEIAETVEVISEDETEE